MREKAHPETGLTRVQVNDVLGNSLQSSQVFNVYSTQRDQQSHQGGEEQKAGVTSSWREKTHGECGNAHPLEESGWLSTAEVKPSLEQQTLHRSGGFTSALLSSSRVKKPFHWLRPTGLQFPEWCHPLWCALGSGKGLWAAEPRWSRQPQRASRGDHLLQRTMASAGAAAA